MLLSLSSLPTTGDRGEHFDDRFSLGDYRAHRQAERDSSFGLNGWHLSFFLSTGLEKKGKGKNEEKRFDFN